MTNYDVFNGDADGLCALLQLRLAQPRETQLVTGVKRDIALLQQVDAGAGDRVSVLDVSLDKNRDALHRVLDAGARVFYCDHHFAGEIPTHPNLETLINTAPDMCTSILVNGRLRNRFVEWAIVGAFGDNLIDSARRLARRTQLKAAQVEQLRQLGTYMNYNGYGGSLEDLHVPPAQLFALLRPHATPDAFITDDRTTFDTLATGYAEDMALAQTGESLLAKPHAAAFALPDEAWARRVSGVWGNELANAHPDRAHAVITTRPAGYLISVRAPLHDKTGADEICRQFPTGGGRKAAAGINALPVTMLEQFLGTFEHFYAQRAAARADGQTKKAPQ